MKKKSNTFKKIYRIFERRNNKGIEYVKRKAKEQRKAQ